MTDLSAWTNRDRADWRDEVANGDTSLGLADWIAHQREVEAAEAAEWIAHRREGYISTPVKACIASALLFPGRRWFLYGIDTVGGYTDVCQSFATWSEAVAALPTFWAEYVSGANR